VHFLSKYWVAFVDCSCLDSGDHWIDGCWGSSQWVGLGIREIAEVQRHALSQDREVSALYIDSIT